MLLGIYLGDCVTTALVCSIGAKANARRVGIFDIVYNLAKTVLIVVGVVIFKSLGVLDGIWDASITSGGIANANTIFNLASALILLPFSALFEKMTVRIVKEDAAEEQKYGDVLAGLNPSFYITPAIALRSSYDALMVMFEAARLNIDRAMGLFKNYDETVAEEILKEEDNIDLLADRISNYLVQLSPHLNEEVYVRTMDQYYKCISEFERLGDHAVNICEAATDLHENKSAFSDRAMEELAVVWGLINRILNHTYVAFKDCDDESARHIEPLEEVVDDLIYVLRDNHLLRMRQGKCNVYVDNDFLNLLSDIERISDICSNVGIAVVARVNPTLANEAHSYISVLHQGNDEDFNREYNEAHGEYFGMLEAN